MTWSLLSGILEDGTPVIVSIDEAYVSPKNRGARNSLLVLNFPGSYMMQSIERRDNVVQGMKGFLSAHDGVYVGGVTRAKKSYTFLFYLATVPERSQVPVPDAVGGEAHVWIAHDPRWTEYLSFVQARRGFWERIRNGVTSLIESLRGRNVTSVEHASVRDDDGVLEALASAGSDLTKATDIVFYLYVPKRGDAETCAIALWERGFRPRVGKPLGELPDGSREDRWSVVSRLEAVPSRENSRSRRHMEELAKQYGGDYDGWEAAITR